MDYNYESLLDERFQMLCQALLAQEYQGLQCYPVGMPDGGRDASAPDALGKGSIIFQIKFAKNPKSIDDPVKWVTDAIEGEIEKVDRLVERGATQYVIISNVPGTSHLDTGRIDKVQAHLTARISIPAQCWWREDIDRRLDGNLDIRLRYPSLLSGIDALALLFSNIGVGEEKDRRERAIKAYLSHQHRRDSTIRFKQAELSPSSLFDLFIDVPAQMQHKATTLAKRKFSENEISFYAAVKQIRSRAATRDHSDDPWDTGQDRLQSLDSFDDFAYMDGDRHSVTVGAADLLTNEIFATTVRRVVLEGAPGQGKSTLAQYLAQIQRTRILSPTAEIGEESSLLRSAPIMVPFKLELRDLAAWLTGVDPWTDKVNEPHNRPKSLEGALAAHVERYSGGVSFDVSDLFKTFGSTPILLILDALDEVADLEERRRVVEEVTSALTRLDQQGGYLQVVITSRPTAIADSPTFSRQSFAYLALSPINKELALVYARKWASARKLEDSDAAEVIETLRQKMNAPHMAELAKNTMQLSILLSLIYLRGASLPDKRTELYDTYVDVFFNRESEKSKAVRDNRELLIDIHRYLGYHLHANAERNKSSGRITLGELRELLVSYLEVEKKSANLLKDLMTGVVERVVALVSRVEGTYEFEVQPLREYFAARHLYDTAPYAPATLLQTGTKPDRFDGIAPNPYWFNVTRFFAGCFTKGEVLDLAERVCSLIRSNSHSGDNFPRVLALSLLQDWVFTQSTPATERVIRTLFDRPGLRWAANRAYFGHDVYGSGVELQLTPEAGAAYLIESVWPTIVYSPLTERVEEICRLLRRQPEAELLIEKWRSQGDSLNADELVNWLQVGGWLNLLRALHAREVKNIVDRVPVGAKPAALRIIATQGGRIESLGAEATALALQAALDHNQQAAHAIYSNSPISMLAGSLDMSSWAWAINDQMNARERNFFERDRNLRPPRNRALKDAYEVLDLLNETVDRDIFRDLSVWTEITQTLREKFGNTWAELEMGVISGAVRDAKARGAGADALFDASKPLTDRVRNARRRHRQMTWWLAQHAQVNDFYDGSLWALALYAWGSPQMLLDLAEPLSQTLEMLPAQFFQNLLMATQRADVYSERARERVEPNIELNAILALSGRTAIFIASRLPQDARMTVVCDRLEEHISDRYSASAALRVILEELFAGHLDTSRAFILAKMCHEAGAISSGFLSRVPSAAFSPELAESILRDSWSLPRQLLRSAYASSKRRTKVTPVASIAARQHWFGR